MICRSHLTVNRSWTAPLPLADDVNRKENETTCG